MKKQNKVINSILILLLMFYSFPTLVVTAATYSLCWPVPKSAATIGTISSGFGPRQSPTSGASSNHRGIDIPVKSGTDVYAAYDGTVVTVGSSSARGNYVVLYHPAIGISTLYQHLTRATVSNNDNVAGGSQIAVSGNTGVGTGAHLHFGVMNGKATKADNDQPSYGMAFNPLSSDITYHYKDSAEITVSTDYVALGLINHRAETVTGKIIGSYAHWQNDWDGSIVDIDRTINNGEFTWKITAKAAGTTDLILKAQDDNYNTIVEKKIRIIVTDDNPKITVSTSSVSLGIRSNRTQTVTGKLTGSYAHWQNDWDGSIVGIERTINNGEFTWKITARAVGTTDLVLKAQDSNNKTLVEKKIRITVVDDNPKITVSTNSVTLGLVNNRTQTVTGKLTGSYAHWQNDWNGAIVGIERTDNNGEFTWKITSRAAGTTDMVLKAQDEKGNTITEAKVKITVVDDTPKPIANMAITINPNSYTYDGTAKQPSVTVKDGNTTLTNGTNYTVEYTNNVNVGTATVTIKGKGNYTGIATKSFTITAKYIIAYTANGGTGTMASDTVAADGTLKIADCAFARNGYRFGGYNVVRSFDNKWYVAGEGWKNTNDINDGGYTKRVYTPDESFQFSDIWCNGVPSGTTYTFYPIWLPNNPKLHCYLNYSGCNYLLGSDLGENYSNYIESRDPSIYTLSVDSTERFNNQKSLKISATSAGSTGKDLVFWTNTNGGRSAGSNGAFDEAGDNGRYTLNFWAKGTVDGAKMYFRWGYTSIFQSVTLTTGWKYYSVPLEKNLNSGKHIHPYIDQAGTFWLNNLTLTSGTDGAPNNCRHETEYEPIEQSYTHGGKYDSLPEPVREGYTFLGWFTEPEDGTQITNQTAVAPYNTAVYARWQKNISDEPVRVIEQNGKLYELYDNNVTWEEAKEFCENKGGHLVAINSAEENNLVASMISDRCCTAWIGAKLNTDKNTWEWLTGEDFSFANWASGEPSGDLNGFYVQMISFNTGMSSSVGRWNDAPNTDDIRSFYCRENCLFVCEYDITIGDANGDGKVNVRDVTAIQRHVAELEPLTGINLREADTNGDGVVDIDDATHLQMYLAEFDVVLGKQS